MGADNTVYYPWGDGMTSFKVNAFRAYFKLNNGLVCGEPTGEGGSINAFVLNFGEGETTGILSTTNLTNDTNSDAWYDLSGRRLSSKPTQSGLYLNNGRKVVIK